MGILKDIEAHKKSKFLPKIIVGSLITLTIGYFSYGYFLGDKTEELVKEINTFSVKTGDLKTSISGDGKILYKQDYNLNFPITGTVKTIDKSEGDTVKAGDIIASLDTTYLELNVDKASIALKKAHADLEAKKNQYSSSDIKLSEEQLGSTQTSLENTKLAGEIDIQNTKTALETAEINLQTALNNVDNSQSLSENDIVNFEIALKSANKDLEIAKSNLVIVENEENQKYDNKLEDAITSIGVNVSFMKEKLLDVDKLLGMTDENKHENDSFDNYLGAKDTSVKKQAESSFNETNTGFNTFLAEWKIYRSGEQDLSKVEGFLEIAENNSRSLNRTLGYTLETVKNSIASAGSLSATDIENYIKSFEESIVDTKKEITSLINAGQVIEEQKTTLDSRILSQNNNIASLESKLLLAESNLSKAKSNSSISSDSFNDKVVLARKQLDQAKINYENAKKKADNNLVLAQKQVNISEASLGTKSVSYSELAPFYTNIENAKKSLEEAQIKLSDAILKSPIDGKIVKINGNIGSFVGGDKDVSFVTITNNNQFYVESFVEELDITRIKNDASVYLTFDAVDGANLPGKVYYISDKSTTDGNGIVSYKVEIGFDPKESGVREGMTTYVEYITNEVKNAKIIPVGAVKSVNGKPSVMLEDSIWKTVITGFTDGKMVEIISGLEKGDKIIY